MKRLLKSGTIQLDIVAILNADSDIKSAVDADLEYREIDFKYRLTDKQLTAYKDFIKSVVSIITKRGFEVVDRYQSQDSYSYYIQFTPMPYKGFEDKMLELDVKFRLSDHYPEHGGDTAVNEETKHSGVIFKNFVVDGASFDNIAATLLEIKELCVDLQQGNYSRF